MNRKIPLTPKSAVTVVALFLGIHAVRPLVDQVYYRVGLQMGAFPTNADSIGIPLSNAWAGWLIGWPFVILVAAILSRTYTGGLSFLFFDWSRIGWSLFWSIPIVILSLWDMAVATYQLRWLQIVDFLDALLLSYVLLSARSSMMIYRGHSAR